jgi:hypothetical protein
MIKAVLSIFIMVMAIGCASSSKVKVSGVITEHHDGSSQYFTVKDTETGKIYRFSKKSEADISDKAGHTINMKAKILETPEGAQNMATVSICTKCHHSMTIE